MKNIKEYIFDLNIKLKRWSDEYYNKNQSSVSDHVYDAKYLELKEIIKQYPELDSQDLVINNVGSQIVDSRFKKIKHKFSMLSIANAFNKEDLQAFDKQIKRELNWNKELKYFLEPKIDGLSISLLYHEGKLQKAITRGDGITGEDVTHNILGIDDIPQKINYQGQIEFRGEIYMPLSVWKSLNDDGDKLANPRNAAAGTIRQLNPLIAQTRKLAAFIYSIPNPLHYKITSYEMLLAFIMEQGFKVNKIGKLFSSIEKLNTHILTFIEKRKELDYEIDGLVIKVNNINLWEEIGFTAKAPKFMIAYKLPAEIVETKLLDIFSTIGRTGRVTYNAKLEAVRLAGSTVTAATLHNADYIYKKNINVGDIVKVKKAGDIIPKVLGVAHKKNKVAWKEEINCPACHTFFSRKVGEVDQYCLNEDCPQKNISKLEHFVSRKAMNIEGFSIQTLKLFISKRLITNFASIFDLHNKTHEILKLEGFKDKSINNLIIAIQSSKQIDLAKFIFALGIRHVGEKTASILARRFGSIDQIKKATINDLKNIRDFGEIVAKSIYNYFKNKNNIFEVNELLNKGIKFNTIKLRNSNRFEGKTFVITGTLSKPRVEFVEEIESNNGNVSSTVTSKTNYLLVGESPGSKKRKADNLNIEVITEKDFKKILKG